MILIIKRRNTEIGQLAFLALLSCLMFIGCSSKQFKTGGNMTFDDEVKTVLKGVTVKNLNGEPVELQSLWTDRRIILTFFRHYG